MSLRGECSSRRSNLPIMRRLLRSLAVTYILTNSIIIELDFICETEFVKSIFPLKPFLDLPATSTSLDNASPSRSYPSASLNHHQRLNMFGALLDIPSRSPLLSRPSSIEVLLADRGDDVGAYPVLQSENANWHGRYECRTKWSHYEKHPPIREGAFHNNGTINFP
jgi:hypothetical protein